ncbi:MAG: helix-turn-helix domain-containing protein [Syntrophorhabdaceae bacterium]|nr:helix-turn-helix domain-containing protein [Syntrophorhabdaceae bacterium]MDI9559795.1 helix-turn-helix transcriptional regulator [Pseudomonadota bacterium]
MNPKTIGYIMYYSRVRRRLSQDELASFARCSQSSITSIENGRTNYYSRNQLLHICKCFYLNENFVDDNDLVSLVPAKYQAATCNVVCSVITARFASLSDDNAILLKRKLVSNGLINETDFTGTYFSSKTIYQIVNKTFQGDLSPLFGVARVDHKVSGINDSISESFASVDNYTGGAIQQAPRRRFRDKDFSYIDDIVSHKVEDPFLKIFSELSIEIKDDLDLIVDFMKVVKQIKFAKQGVVKDTIRMMTDRFLTNEKSPYFTPWM